MYLQRGHRPKKNLKGWVGQGGSLHGSYSSEMQWLHLAPHRCVPLLISSSQQCQRCPTCDTKMLYTFSQQKTAFCPIFSVSGRADPIGALTTSTKTRDVNISSQRFNSHKKITAISLPPSIYHSELQDTYGLYFVYFCKAD